ncbi:MAG: ArnT family glycosyltransferase, partial [Minisyncoccia bacterium]
LPKNEYSKFYYRNEKELETLKSNINKEYIEKSWEISKKNDTKLERSRFNIIRSFHPDEENILKSISNMKPEKLDFNPHFFEYPSFYIYIVAITLKILSIFKIIYITSDITYYFKNPSEIGKFYLTGRFLTLTFGILTLFFLSNISEKLKKGSFNLTFILLLFSPLFIINSHYMTVDIPMLFWITLFLFFLVRYFETHNLSFFYLSSISIGLATGTKYPALILWFLIPYVLILSENSLIEILKKTGISFFILIFSFILTTPYSLISFDEFKRDFLYQFFTRGVGINFQFLLANIKEISEDLFLIHGLPLFFYILSFIFLIFKMNKKLSVIYSGLILTFTILIFTKGFKYGRYYLLPLPFMILIFSIFLKELLETGKLMKYVFLLFLVFILLINGLKTGAYLRIMSKEDVRIISAKYVDENLKEHSDIFFIKDPWIFEVCPVNFFKYNIKIIEEEQDLKNASKNSYLIIGELQYFLTKGSRKKIENEIIEKMKVYNFSLVKKFENESEIFNLKFDYDRTLHDLIYTHPKIFLFKKNEGNI